MKNVESIGFGQYWTLRSSSDGCVGSLRSLHWDGNIQSTKTSMFHSAAAPAAVKPNFPNYGPTALAALHVVRGLRDTAPWR